MSGMPLPILEFCNRLIALARCLSALRSGRMPAFVARQAPGLAAEYGFWQNTLWKGFHQGLIGHGIIALALNCRQLVREGRGDRGRYQALVSRPGAAGPAIHALFDVVANQLAMGASYVGHLRGIARHLGSVMEGDDLTRFRAIMATMEGQLDAASECLVGNLLAEGGPIVVAITDIGLAAGGNGAILTARGIVQIGPAVARPSPVPADVLATARLALDWWAGAEPALRQAAQLILMIDRLADATARQSFAMDTLAAIRNDCRQVCAMIDTGPPDQWADAGLRRLADWADAMMRIEFAEPVSRQIPG
ncbi:hypothetical protein FBZ91_101132 [Nitrospirillum viridazoti]|nr:hypothetical protein FBZ91_101132 [Nitrospirillum amazonense]